MLKIGVAIFHDDLFCIVSVIINTASFRSDSYDLN